MSAILAAARKAARTSPRRIALIGDGVELSFQELQAELEHLYQRLVAGRYRAIGLLLDNSPAWVVIDLAAQRARIPLVPLPAFFSRNQLLHTLCDAGVDVLLTDAPKTLCQILERSNLRVRIGETHTIAGRQVYVFSLRRQAKSILHAGVTKITYTSGTTGTPKGVCLEQGVIDQVAKSLVVRTGVSAADCHLSLLPLTTLLENIGGVYVPLLAGATCCLPSLDALGVHGAAHIDVARLIGALGKWRASTAIIMPQMLQGLVELLERGASAPSALRFLAVGGAPVSTGLLHRAEACGLPVYEGYGLSECASVVAVNGPGQRRIGSVGRPLPHVGLHFANDGEILVAGPVFSRYLGDDPVTRAGATRTGDLGYMDEEGYLYITGRKKHMFVTSFGRNVAPEWVERELALQPAVAQAAVFGEGRPWNMAVIVPAAGSDSGCAALVETAIAKANEMLPDYARISIWLLADALFSYENGQLTGTGRVRREAVWARYRARIERMYQQTLEEQSARCFSTNCK